MLDRLLDILGSSRFDSDVISPLLGLLYGVILTGLTKRPGQNAATRSPDDIKKQIEDYRKRSSGRQDVHHHHYHGSRPGDDAATMMFIVGILMLVSLFLFAVFLPQIAGTLVFVNTTVAVCCVTASILACLTGRFDTTDLWSRVVFPAAISLGSFWLTVKARDAISPDVVNYAHGLIAQKPLSVGAILQSAITFIRSLHDDYVRWMLLDMLAFICAVTCTIFALLRFVYYVCLSNAREGGSRLWVSLALRTAKFGGTGSAIFAVVLLAFGAFLAQGDAYRLLQQAF